MIVGTAGHIDHGKTSLVRALTGVDTDRLSHEKERGISIELGYAYLPTGSGPVMGFIDVPGHERLVHTMAAGASGIDFGLLLVAADDGIMPQTLEHLAILQLLGIQRGALVISKVDRVSAHRLNEVSRQLSDLVRNTFLEQAPVFPVSLLAGQSEGTEALLQYLQAEQQRLPDKGAQALFRLAIDRVFTLPGHGTVVTGTVHAGQVKPGDGQPPLLLMPAGTPVRVRSIHAQNRSSSTGRAGQRCALNLGGLRVNKVARGNWVADARAFLPSYRLDVSLTLLPSSSQSLRAWSVLHVHLAAGHYVAHVVPLSGDKLEPGQRGRVQLVFDEAVCASPGDRFIVRDAQARQTVGGGQVLDPDAPDRKRRSPARVAWLDGLEALLRDEGLSALLEQAPYGLDQQALMRLTGCAQPPALPGAAVWVGTANAGRTLVSQARWEALAAQVLAVMARFHEAVPDEPGLDQGRLRRMAWPSMPEALWSGLVDALLEQQQLVRQGAWLHLPGHSVSLTDAEQQLASRLVPLLRCGGFDPPWVRELAEASGHPEDEVRQVLRKLVRQGVLFQVVRDLFYHSEQIARLAALFRQLAQPDGVQAARFRDATGLGRKRAIQILEYFGRVGFTRRVADRHLLRPDSPLFGVTQAQIQA